ncbi:unnamed protein product [Closterium sp. Yama58-4]|nr:unnamed protein product [Closterium sp. Yama58-4]
MASPGPCFFGNCVALLPSSSSLPVCSLIKPLHSSPIASSYDLPAVAYTWCGGNNNCLTTPSKCASAGPAQRAATECAFCNTTNGVGPFCVGPGGVCTLDASARVAAGTVNSFSQPTLPMSCAVPPVVMKETAEAVSRMGLCCPGQQRPQVPSWSSSNYSKEPSSVLLGIPTQQRPQGPWVSSTCSRSPWDSNSRCLPCCLASSPAPLSPAMLAIKASLGVTYTTWDATVLCQPAGKLTTATVWSGVLCDSTGSVVSIALDGGKCDGPLPTDISTLTALTYLRAMLHCMQSSGSRNDLLPSLSLLAPHSNLQGNLLNYRLNSFTTSLRLLPALADIRLHYNYLYGEIPSFLVGLPKLTQFGAVYNYLIGSVPALASGLRSLDVRGNFLTDVPTASYTFCGCAGNCMLTPSKCISGGTAQRPATDCAFCGTTNAVGPFCWGAGGECVVDASALWAARVVNSPSQPVQPIVCVGGTVVALDPPFICRPPPTTIPAMLALKSSLGVPFNTWAASVPCTIKGVTASVPTWSYVLCDAAGSVVRIELSNTGLTGYIPTDISKLTALSFLYAHLTPHIPVTASHPSHTCDCISPLTYL